MRVKWIAGLALLVAAPAGAEVVAAGTNAMHLRQSIQLVTPQASVLEAFGRIGEWWNPEHTYSGDSSKLRLQLTPGGCFCEALQGGGIEHLRVTYYEPGKRLVLTGSLGPLLYEGTAGVMDLRVERVAGGSRLTMNYKVAGFASGGADRLAPLVDGVLSDQMRRLRAFLTAQPRVR